MSKDYKNIHYFLMTYSDWRKKIDVELPNGYDEWLDEITTFNLNARYDDYKQSFHKLCLKMQGYFLGT